MNANAGKKRRAPSSPSQDINIERDERKRPRIPPNAPTAPRRMISNPGGPSGEELQQRANINLACSSNGGRDDHNPGELSRVVGLAERLEFIARKLIDAHAHIHNLERQLMDAKADNDNLERKLAEAKAENELQERVLATMDMRIAALEAWEEADDQERR